MISITQTIMNILPLPLAITLAACTGSVTQVKEENNTKLNVLFIAIDDLRPELGCYGNGYIRSPHMDALAREGMVFTNHFVSVPTCGASRYSLLTGMHPRTAAHLSNEACRTFLSGQPESDIPETFVHHLRRNGYYTVGVGKISHYVDGLLYGYRDQPGTEYELPHSWDEMLLDAGKWGTGWNAFFGYADGENRQSRNNQVKPYEMADVPDNGYPDGLITDLALEKLGELAKRDKPFFLGVGFFKPHLPFNAPKRYWDMYDPDQIPLPPNPYIPENVHPASLHGSSEFNGYRLGDEEVSLAGPVSDEYARTLRHAYFACISYIDAQVGRLMAELEELGLAENTVVVIWGDHGWHLGEHLVWGKHTIFEKALKSALIIRVPGMTSGEKTDHIVSTVDLYPTLMELSRTGMPYPADGRSLVPLLRNKDADWENAAYGYFRNGITLRTENFRLTKYFRKEMPVVELYDHTTDSNETINVAAERPDIVQSLMPLWERGNTGLFR
jgi:arylsulfatase A-like enzyme